MSSQTNFFESLAEAQHDYITQNYISALNKYSDLIKSAQTPNYNLHISRGYTFWKLNRSSDLIEDAKAAIKINDNKYEGHHLLALGYFLNGDLDNASNSIEKAKLIASSQFEIADARRVDVGAWARKIELQRLKNPSQNVQNTSTSKVVAPPQKISYVWRQTDARVYIEIKFGLKKPTDLQIKFDTKKCEVGFPISDSRNFELNLELFDEIIPEECGHNIQLSEIEIILFKKNKGFGWSSLENKETLNEIITETVTPGGVVTQKESVPFYPSSSKVKRDWSKIDKEIEEDMKLNKNEYKEEDDLNKLFKEIYKNADEDTRRAMIKSFQTSNGTVLSTNWGEVKEKQYDGKDRPSAPDGQEWRK